jgi:hypothetical protein
VLSANFPVKAMYYNNFIRIFKRSFKELGGNMGYVLALKWFITTRDCLLVKQTL